MRRTMTIHFKVLFYHFTPKEVDALYRLVYTHLGYIPDDDEIREVISKIGKIVESSNGLPPRNY